MTRMRLGNPRAGTGQIKVTIIVASRWSHQYFINFAGFIGRRCYKFTCSMLPAYFCDTIINSCLAQARCFRVMQISSLGVYCWARSTRNVWEAMKTFMEIQLSGMRVLVVYRFSVDSVSTFTSTVRKIRLKTSHCMSQRVTKRLGALADVPLSRRTTIERHPRGNSQQITGSIRWWNLGVINWISAWCCW